MNSQGTTEILTQLISRTKKVVFAYNVATSTITYLNHAFTRIWELPQERAVAEPTLILEAVHPEDKPYLLGEYDELLQGAVKENLEFRIRCKDGSMKWLLLDALLVTDEQGEKHITGIVEDITIVKENLNTLQKYGAKKNSVLEILSHDLAGPLANIQGLADLLTEYTREYDNEEVENIIRIIRESRERNILLIREFVKQEFLESVSVELFKRRVNLVRKLEEVVGQYKAGMPHIQKEIRFVAPAENIFVYIDDAKFMQVINNLFSNSIKFTPDNGVITLELKDKGNAVLITIQDNGIGIPEKYHERLFEKFSPARRQGLRGEPSTGLGMSIIKTIVEWHSGRIRFESTEGKGTTFYIELPKE